MVSSCNPLPSLHLWSLRSVKDEQWKEAALQEIAASKIQVANLWILAAYRSRGGMEKPDGCIDANPQPSVTLRGKES